jgi:hypothetical protein
MTVFPLTNQGLENAFVQNRRETCKKIQPITSQEATLSTNHVRALCVPLDVLTDVVHWSRKGCMTGQYNLFDVLDGFRREALEGAKYCYNAGCEVTGQMKDFKVCPQCKTSRYCGEVCQQADWITGGHKAKCGTYASHFRG